MDYTLQDCFNSIQHKKQNQICCNFIHIFKGGLTVDVCSIYKNVNTHTLIARVLVSLVPR